MKHIQGDLLKIESGLILHQVNNKAVTGGLAGALRRKYPAAFHTYIDACEGGDEVLGKCVIAGAGLDLTIAHIFGQEFPGPNTDLELVQMALIDLQKWIQPGSLLSGKRIYAPHMMGCGLGGGNWPDYLKLLVKHIPDIIIVKKN